jgi:hypothetical protein
MSSLLRNTCLKPTYSLRRQLLLGFGSTALISLTIVVSVAIILANLAGNTVKDRSEKLLNRQIEERLQKNSLFVAETVDGFAQNFAGTVRIVVELVQDRIVGYPEPGWENDTYIPFRDHDTGTNIYPLKARPLPMDFEIYQHTNSTRAREDVQERVEWITSGKLPPSSTGNASYFIQGMCDPHESDSEARTYYPNCTEANNDMSSGGVVQPTRTNKALYEKSAEIGVLLKPLFESHAELFLIGVYYVNSGAGAAVYFPGNVREGQLAPYTSMGCDWMR